MRYKEQAHTLAHTQRQAAVAGNFHLDWQKDLPPKAATIIHVHVGAGAETGSMISLRMAKKVKYENIRQHKRAINTENTWKTQQHTAQHTERVDYGNLFPVCSLWTWADHYKNAICAIRRRDDADGEATLTLFFILRHGRGQEKGGRGTRTQ